MEQNSTGGGGNHPEFLRRTDQVGVFAQPGAQFGAKSEEKRPPSSRDASPHPCHRLVTDGAFSADGQFLPLPSPDASAVMEVFRRMLLLRLRKAERLSGSFMQNLLSWVHPGFSVHAGPQADAAEIASMESQARYITRPALAMEDSHHPASFEPSRA